VRILKQSSTSRRLTLNWMLATSLPVSADQVIVPILDILVFTALAEDPSHAKAVSFLNTFDSLLAPRIARIRQAFIHQDREGIITALLSLHVSSAMTGAKQLQATTTRALAVDPLEDQPCQWPFRTARRRPVEMPAGGHENCHLMFQLGDVEQVLRLQLRVRGTSQLILKVAKRGVDGLPSVGCDILLTSSLCT